VALSDTKSLEKRVRDLERELRQIRGSGGRTRFLGALDMMGHEIHNIGEPRDNKSAATKKTIEGEVSGKSIVTAVTEPTLPKHRVLTGSTNVVVTDDFPLKTITVSLDTEDLDLDGLQADDFMAWTWFMRNGDT
jgi:hypothetical protein